MPIFPNRYDLFENPAFLNVRNWELATYRRWERGRTMLVREMESIRLLKYIKVLIGKELLDKGKEGKRNISLVYVDAKLKF